MNAHARWYDAARAAVARGERAVIVGIAAGVGSTPREAGAAMVVTPTVLDGTIGGGHLEFEATRIAREALAARSAPACWLVRFPLAARLGQCCGGVATVAFATIDAAALAWLDVACACARASTPFAIVSRLGDGEHAGSRLVVTGDDARGSLGDSTLDSAAVREGRARLAAGGPRAGAIVAAGADTLLVHLEHPDRFVVCLFGNGHVGRALVQVLATVDADVRWIDTRESDFPPDCAAQVTIVATDDPAGEVATLPRGAYVAVMTHSHPLDFDIVEAALARDDWSYVGLIGSKSKRAQFERRLLARGTTPQALQRLMCPIGAGVLQRKEPGVIAIAIATELLKVREARADRRVPPATRTVAPARGLRGV